MGTLSVPNSAFPSEVEGRWYPVMTDNMAPSLRQDRHLVFGVPVGRFCGEAMYVFDNAVVYMAERRIGGGIHVWSFNKDYPGQDLTDEQFVRIVEAKVIATIELHDHEDQRQLWGLAGQARRSWPSVRPRSRAKPS